MTEQLDDMYRDIIMEHYRYPRGHKEISEPDLANQGHNPVCGDVTEIKLTLDGDRIEDISVNCVGCAISVASGSMLADMIEGKTISDVRKIAEVVRALIKGEEIDTDLDLGDLEALEGVRNFPVRIKCALLSWTTLVDAIEAREVGQTVEASTTE
ncbi:MAG: SUF system NifU family Fe-S cluster assembly protein [candidate division Zixibacteria bacterium]|nr:SUF system NifU family Fe-S cluster assembly protein [candidate division Zixibacteria bacterium]